MAAAAAGENRGRRPREEAEATDTMHATPFPTRHNTSLAPEFHEIVVIFCGERRNTGSTIDTAEFGHESMIP
jgi:hypothetical protein